jgi:SAM domain (Sterile alpha motif)
LEQIAEWLGKLGLEQYAKLFSNNDIDVSVLPHLSDKDLKDLGVSLGHRRKIFAAINKALHQSSRLPKLRDPKNPQSKTRPSAATLLSCSQTWWAQPPYLLASIPKICAT